jgi:hypothetical protein
MTETEMLELTHRLQAWRPDRLTLELNEELTEPFCADCADWHEPDEPHSYVSDGEQWLTETTDRTRIAEQAIAAIKAVNTEIEKTERG